MARIRTVNMTPTELRTWAKDDRSNLTGTPSTEHYLHVLPGLLELSRWDADAETKVRFVENLNQAHLARNPLFEDEVQHSGWSQSHLALLCRGHDPSKPSSCVYSEDQHWLIEHPGAAVRRRNPKRSFEEDEDFWGLDEGSVFDEEKLEASREEGAARARAFIAEKQRVAEKIAYAKERAAMPRPHLREPSGRRFEGNSFRELTRIFRELEKGREDATDEFIDNGSVFDHYAGDRLLYQLMLPCVGAAPRKIDSTYREIARLYEHLENILENWDRLPTGHGKQSTWYLTFYMRLLLAFGCLLDVLGQSEEALLKTYQDFYAPYEY
jgi:hypothetical protein